MSEVNIVNLRAPDLAIDSVNLYPHTAEIKRFFALELKRGTNRVVLEALPNALRRDSVRVEGTGRALISNVSIRDGQTGLQRSLSGLFQRLHIGSQARSQANPCSHVLDALRSELARLHRRKESLIFKKRAYQSCVSNQAELGPEPLDHAVAHYDKISEQLDAELGEVENSIAEVARQEQIEKDNKDREEETLSVRLSVDLEVEEGEGEEVTLCFMYYVDQVSWSPIYDLRVSTQEFTKDNLRRAHLSYRAAISQTTGEDWRDVKLTLQSSSPDSRSRIPALRPWRVSIGRPKPQAPPSGKGLFGSAFSAVTPQRMSMPAPESDAYWSAPNAKSRSMAPMVFASVTDSSSLGDVYVSFSVVGKISVGGDGAMNQVRVLESSLEAKLGWWVQPQSHAASVLIKADIENTSGYTLLAGDASIFLDGSFVSKSRIGPANLDEKFTAWLGSDPSIRLASDPSTRLQSVNASTKTISQTRTQAWHVSNTRAKPIEDLNVVVRLPVAEDNMIHVDVIEPKMGMEGASFAVIKSNAGSTVTVRWDANHGKSEDVPITDEGAVEGGEGNSGSGILRFNMARLNGGSKQTFKLKWSLSWPEDKWLLGL